MIDAGEQLAQRCANGCRRVLVWHDDVDACPRCGGPLTAPVLTRRQRWSSSYEHKGETERALRTALGRLDVGNDPIPERITVTELAERWYAHMEALDRPKLKVRRGYRRDVDAHVVPMIGGEQALKVKPAHVQQCLDRFAEGRAPRTVQRLRAACSSMFTYALRMSIIPVNPVSATTTPTPTKPKLTIPGPGEVRAIIDAAADIGAPFAIPTLLAATAGARRSEVLAVRWSSIDLDAGSLRIERTLQRVVDELVFSDAGKTAHATRTVPLPAFAVERLRAHRADQARRRLALGPGWVEHDLVCERGDGAPLDPDLFSHAFRRRIAPAAGVDCNLHALRHAFATRLARSGLHPAETSAIVGHASAAFTATTYQHATAETLERTRAAVEEAFSEGPR